MIYLQRKIKIKPLFVLLFVAIFVMSVNCSRRIAQNRFNDLVSEYIDSYFKFHPVRATSVGYDRYNDLLGDYSDSSVSRYLSTLSNIQTRLVEMDTSLFSSRNIIDYRIISDHLASEVWQIQNEQIWKLDPTFYIKLLTNAVLGIEYSNNYNDQEKCVFLISRLEETKRIFKQARQNLVNPYRFKVNAALDQLHSLSYLYTSELNRFIRLCPEKQDTLLYYSKLFPDSLAKFQDFLASKTGRNNSVTSPQRSYDIDDQIRTKYNLEIDIDDLLLIAQKEYDHYYERLEDVTTRLYKTVFPKRRVGLISLENRIKSLTEKFGNDYIQDDKLIDEENKIIFDLKRFIEMKNVMNIPELDSLLLMRTHGYELMDDITGLRKPGPLDEKKIYRFYIKSLPDDLTWFEQISYLREYTRSSLQLQSIQKLIPGSMLADIYWNEQKSVVRRLFKNRYIEAGWPILATEIMIEYGFGGYDPKLQFYHFLSSLRRITKFQVDLQLNSERIRAREALNVLRESGFMKVSAAQKNLNEMIVHPVNSIYVVYGSCKLKEIYSESRKIAGNYFERTSYWDMFFRIGSIPPDCFEKSFLEMVNKQYKKK